MKYKSKRLKEFNIWAYCDASQYNKIKQSKYGEAYKWYWGKCYRKHIGNWHGDGIPVGK